MKFALSLLLLGLSVLNSAGQESISEDTLQAIMDEAIRINITAHILPPGKKAPLNFEKSKSRQL